MKKIYTLIAAVAMFGAVNAQDDFAVNLVSHTAGDSDDADPLAFEFNVENVGSTTIPTGDTLWVSLAFDGGIVSLNLVSGQVSGFILAEDFAPGDIFAVPVVNIDWLPQPAGTTVDLCAVVYGAGEVSFSGEGETIEDIIVGDDNTSDNSSCITAELPTDFTGIEDNELGLTNIYYAFGQLNFVTEGVEAGKLVNLNIVNINGQMVQNESFVLNQGTNSIALKNLAAGIYIVAIEVEGVLVTRKFSIQ